MWWASAAACWTRSAVDTAWRSRPTPSLMVRTLAARQARTVSRTAACACSDRRIRAAIWLARGLSGTPVSVVKTLFSLTRTADSAAAAVAGSSSSNPRCVTGGPTASAAALSTSRACLTLSMSVGVGHGEHLIEAFAQAGRERSGVGDSVWVEVDRDAARALVGHHRHHGGDARAWAHR